MSAGLALFALLCVWAAVLWSCRERLLRLWREPVLRHPVLIVESDDWGPGPDSHAQALKRLCEVLTRHRDATGRPAVMSVATVLSISNNQALRGQAAPVCADKSLAAPEFAHLRDALRDGHERGVFALQLHGMTHFWPATLARQAAIPGSPAAQWVESDDGWSTESLPAHLQSRWIDADRLPSGELSDAEIARAVNEEVSAFTEIFGFAPVAVVPPTFVWNERVEAGWRQAGVEVLITPGRRYTGRDANGRPDRVDREYYSGERTTQGMTSLVRDVYFEPVLGHKAESVLAQASARFGLGRPALLETHRFNFTGSDVEQTASLGELDRLLDRLLAVHSDLRFMAPAELGAILAQSTHPLVVSDLSGRLQCWLRRVWQVGRLRKLAWASGLVLPAALAHFFTKSSYGQPQSARGLTQ